MFRNYFHLIWLGFFIVMTGCAGLKIWHPKTDVHHDLKKRILVLRTLNYSGLEETIAKQTRSQFLEAIQKGDPILIQKDIALSASNSQPPKVILPEFGIWSDAELLKKAEEEGLSILLLPILNPFEIHEIRTGIWPLLKNKQELELSMTLNVFDPIHHLVYLIPLESQKITLPKFDQGLGFGDPVTNEQRWKSIPEAAWQKHWSHIITRQAAAFLKETAKQPWTGQILSIESETVLINAGRDIGLQDGQVFEVFEKVESQQGAGIWKVFIEGPKVGEIKVTKTMDKTALAVPLDKAEIKPGQLIRVKN
jgi:hypothetical protein